MKTGVRDVEKSKEKFLMCGGQICAFRRDLAAVSILIGIFVPMPFSGLLRLYPEILGYIDARQIIFLLPVLFQIICWGLAAGCYLCLISNIEEDL